MGSKQSKTSPEISKDKHYDDTSDEDIEEVDDLLEEAKLSREEEAKLGQEIPLRSGRRRSSLVVENCLHGHPKDSDHQFRSQQSVLPDIDIKNYDYPFDNIVFEGGGNKGLAFSGAIKVLEEVGIWKNIHRFAGTSSGAMNAALLAVGYDYEDTKRFLEQDLSKLFLDHSCGYCSLLPNLIRYYGWNPGRQLLYWFGQRLHDATGDKDITFKEIYDRHQNELCVIVTNVNRMDAEYCHVKTTPNMPVRLAVRMSMSIPGIFQGVQYHNNTDLDLYVDGGLLCNYAIHSFDGWWLSMDPENSFVRKLQPLRDIGRLWDRKERFGEFNPNTIGILLFSGDEQEVMKNLLNQRPGMGETPKRPKTKLARSRMEIKRRKAETARRHEITVAALSKFLQVLSDSNLDNNNTISKEELNNAFSKTEVFTADHAAELFGSEYTMPDVFDFLDVSGDGQISFQELILFAEKKGVDLQAEFLGYERKPVDGLMDFFGSLQEALLVNVKRIFFDERDADRTIGVDTDYIQTTDFKMEQADKDFVVEQGARAATAFLKYYITKFNLSPRNTPQDNSKLEGKTVNDIKNGDSHVISIDVSPPLDNDDN